MTRRITLALSLAAIAALASPGLSPRPAGARNIGKGPAARLVYQANFKTRPGDWRFYNGSYDVVSNTPERTTYGISLSGAALVYNDTHYLEAVAPFRVRHLGDFAVEARMTLSSNVQNPAVHLFAKGSVEKAVTGVLAGWNAEAGPTARNAPNVFFNWDSEPIFLPAGSFVPGVRPHVYRMEVRGDLYRLLIDRHTVIGWTAVKLPTASDEVGLILNGAPTKISSFKVFMLPKGSARPVLNTAAILDRAVPPSEFNLPPFVAYFRDNKLYAADTQVDEAMLQSWGRVTGYLQGYDNRKDSYAEESLNVYKAAAGAKASYDYFLGRLPGNSQFQPLDVSGRQLGDEAFAFLYEYDYQGSHFYRVTVILRTGTYYISVKIQSTSRTTALGALNLAERAVTHATGAA